MFADYLDPARAHYLRDDAGRSGGLATDTAFVVLGDLNADPQRGDAAPAIRQLLEHPRVNGDALPAAADGNACTAHWSAGDFRVDYVLPDARLDVVDAGVFWPAPEDPLARLIEGNPPPSSDHRLVWMDLSIW